MGIKKLKPATSGTRFRSNSTFEEITKSTPEKSLTVSLKNLVVEIILDTLQPDLSVAVTRGVTELSILKEINLALKLKFFQLNTIQTEVAE